MNLNDHIRDAGQWIEEQKRLMEKVEQARLLHQRKERMERGKSVFVYLLGQALVDNLDSLGALSYEDTPSDSYAWPQVQLNGRTYTYSYEGGYPHRNTHRWTRDDGASFVFQVHEGGSPRACEFRRHQALAALGECQRLDPPEIAEGFEKIEENIY